MPDVFDEIETTPKQDVFDELEAPEDVFDSLGTDEAAEATAPISGRALGTETAPPIGSDELPVLEKTDPLYPSAMADVEAGQIVVNQFLLPAKVDAFAMLSQAERSGQVAVAEVKARQARERLNKIGPDPFNPDYYRAREEEQALSERAKALNARYQADTPLGRMQAEDVASAQREEQMRKDFEASGEGPGVVGTFMNKVAGMAASVGSGVLKSVAPSFGTGPAVTLGRESADMEALANVNQSTGGKIARGAATVSGLLLGNPTGAIPATAAVGLKGAMDAHTQVLQQTGNASEADRVAMQTFPALALYMATGIAGARAAAGMVPVNAAPATKALAGFAGAGIANIGTTAAMAAAEGRGYGIEELTADTLLAIFHAKGEYSRGASEAAQKRAEAELLSRGFSEQQISRPIEVGENAPSLRVTVEPGDKPPPMDSISMHTEVTPAISLAEKAGETVTPEAAQVEPPPDPTVQRKLGPGAANIEEFPAKKPIGAYNAAVDTQRAERGLEPLMSEARKADPVTWDAAEQRLETDPDYGRNLVEDINAGRKESVSDTEQAALLREMIAIRNERDNATTRSMDENTYTQEERQGFAMEANRLEERLQVTEEADRKAGTAQGRALRIRRLMAYEDFTLAGLMGKARRAKGGELSPQESADITAKATRFEKAKNKFEERQRKLEEETPVDDAIRAIEAEAAKDPNFSPEVRSLADRIVSRLEKASRGASERIRGLMSQLGSAPDVGVAVKLTKEFAIMAATDIARAGVKFGQWAAKMVREFGDKVKPFLADAWKQADADIDAQVSGTRTKKPKEVKAAVTKENAGALADQIGAGMKERVAGGEKLTAMRGDIQKLVETLVRGGIKQREPLVDAVHEVLKGVEPDITRRQAMDAISGYGDFKPLNKDAVKAEVRDLKGQLQQVGKMEDILAGDPMKKTGVERRTPSDEERKLIKQVNELAREKGVKVTDPEVQLKSILGSIETRLTNRIKDLRAEIQKGELAVRKKTPAPTNDKIKALRDELAQVEAQHEAVFGKQARPMTDEQKLRAYKTRTTNRIKELEERMAKGDFETRKRKPLDLSKDPEAVKAQTEMQRVKGEFQAKQRAWERSQWSAAKRLWEGIKSVADASANLATSLDLSALRQGVKAFTARPLTGLKNIGAMLKSFASETKAREIEAEIRLRPNAKLYKEAGLEITPIDETSFTATEENMGSRLAEKIPGVRASNRAFKTFLNRMRADTFDAIVGMKGRPLEKTELEAVGNFVNVATGRGNFGRFQGAVPLLGRVYWSPRLLLSQIQHLIGKPLWSGSGWSRKVIAKEYGRYLAGTAALFTLAKLAGWGVGDDPTSADFGKVIIGNTRIDPMGGLAQVMTLVGRLATGESTDAKGRTKEKDAGDVLGKFNRSKLSPFMGTAWDIISGKQYSGEPTTIGTVARNVFVPLSLRDLPDDIKEDGLAKALAMWVSNLFGISARSY